MHSSEKNIRQQVFDLNFDLKAETFVSYLQEETELDIALTDFFKRRFSNDITGIQESDDHDDRFDITLSRRSFYNIFPERFFHATYSSTAFVDAMVADYKNRKVEEFDARRFFKPLETEFFLNRVDIETLEDRTFKNLGSIELVDFLVDLWRIDPKMPKRMAAKILKTMPFMYKIAGNLPLLKVILENIVEEHISIRHDFASTALQTENEPWQLGVNMATAGQPKSFLPKYIFTMTDISRPEMIQDYLPDGRLTAVVQFFLEYTLPLECDFEIDFTLAKTKRKFLMSEAAYSGRLGKSTTI